VLKCSGRHPYSVDFPIRTIQWYVVRCAFKNTHQNDIMFLMENCIVCLKYDDHERFYSQRSWGDLYDHVMSTRNLHFHNKYDVYMGSGNFYGDSGYILN
jgi:hypothetical protein